LLINREGGEVARKLGEAQWNSPELISLVEKTIHAQSASNANTRAGMRLEIDDGSHDGQHGWDDDVGRGDTVASSHRRPDPRGGGTH